MPSTRQVKLSLLALSPVWPPFSNSSWVCMGRVAEGEQKGPVNAQRLLCPLPAVLGVMGKVP